jgi:hypothetical protein
MIALANRATPATAISSDMNSTDRPRRKRAGLLHGPERHPVVDHAQDHGGRSHADQEEADLLRAFGARQGAGLGGGLQELVDREPEAEHRQRGAQPGHQRPVRRQHGAQRAEIGGKGGASSGAFGHGDLYFG